RGLLLRSRRRSGGCAVVGFGLRGVAAPVTVVVDQVALLVLVGLEVGLVPAAALEAEHGRGHQLLQLVPAAFGAFLQWRVGDLLQHFDLRAAGRTLVLVEWHGRDYTKVMGTNGAAGRRRRQ